MYLCRVKTAITRDLNKVLEALENGFAVGIPTETVYGLAANALNSEAVRSIFTIKGRPPSNPLILHFYDRKQAEPFIQEFHPELEVLERVFSPGPITFVVPKTDLVPSIITAGNAQVALRFPSQPDLRTLLSKVAFPLAAPSANKYGEISPTEASHVLRQLDGKISWVLDGGPCTFGLESTIVGMEDSLVTVYRLGSISLDDLSAALGYIPKVKNHASDVSLAPGMVKYHYAPKTPLRYYSREIVPKENTGYIFLSTVPEGFPVNRSCVLSARGDYREIARNLYRVLLEMDSRDFEELYIERPLPEGLGLTLLDRLNRATAKFQ